jgi:hypothetical protein
VAVAVDVGIRVETAEFADAIAIQVKDSVLAVDDPFVRMVSGVL